VESPTARFGPNETGADSLWAGIDIFVESVIQSHEVVERRLRRLAHRLRNTEPNRVVMRSTSRFSAHL